MKVPVNLDTAFEQEFLSAQLSNENVSKKRSKVIRHAFLTADERRSYNLYWNMLQQQL